MTYYETIKTIREALESAISDATELGGSVSAEKYNDALAVLDKLAAEPSEDARELVRKVLTAYGDSSMKASGYAYVAMFNESAVAEAAELITARDERIKKERDRYYRGILESTVNQVKRECADKATAWLAELHGEVPDPTLPWSSKLMWVRALQVSTLTAAIMGE